MTVENTYLIFKEDFKHRNWVDWIMSHIMLGPPPFRYKGALTFTPSGFRFKGYDMFTKDHSEFEINKRDITQLYHGYDNTFSRLQVKGNLSFAPIRVRLNTENEETDLYVVSEFNGMTSANTELFEEMKIWLS
ncbi:hypothetical protein ACH3O9_04180 [Leeuwenhoekiella sp. A16]|uniref:hypothetical protein n=1 Tax=unclassified Leeuwenhoekiella TaxID=2615029 RepID=UPI003A7FC0CF